MDLEIIKRYIILDINYSNYILQLIPLKKQCVGKLVLQNFKYNEQNIILCTWFLSILKKIVVKFLHGRPKLEICSLDQMEELKL